MAGTTLETARKIQHGEIDESIVPGTIQLVDLDRTIHARHAKAQSDIILVPTPSDDPDDPLNWSRPRKMLALTCMCVYTWFNGVASSNLYSALVPLSEATHISIGTLNAGTGYLFLLAGWSLLLWQPLALQYGKRPVYLASLCGLLAFSTWAPFVKSDGQWLAKSVLQGFFVSPIEALPEITVTDLFFAHERGTYMAVYSFVLAGSNYFAPVICGFINEYQGWRWVFFYPSIFVAASIVFLFFFMEETNYDRRGVTSVPHEAFPSSQDRVLPDNHYPRDNGEDGSTSPRKHLNTATSPPADLSRPPYKRKTYLQKLALWDKPRPQRMGYRALLSLRLLGWPVVFYAGFSYGSYLIWFNVLNATTSIILGGAPYHFSSGLVGLAYLAPLLGVVAAALYTGYLSDWLALRLARRNGGVFEPEHRLWGFALSTIVLPASLILWGVGAAHDVHLFGLIVAMLGLSFASTCGVTLSINYVVDSYRDLSGDAITTIILVRNTMSFAIGYGITPWLDNLGYQNCFVSAAFIGLAASAVFLVMIWKGKALRESFRVRYWRLVRRNVEMGMVH